MKIALLGYGKMGKEIERLALEKRDEIVCRIDNEKDWLTQYKGLSQADVAIDFSQPHAAPDNILKCFSLGIPVVCGTTGWKDRFEEIRQVCLKEKQALFYAPNFSIGVNLFFSLNGYLAQLMDNYPEYDVNIEEIHHITKADSPSGTAIYLADQITEHIQRKKGWVTDQNTNLEQIGISSVREGNKPGTHVVSYESEFDLIEIKHTAKNRRGFALGALMAAKWIIGKQGCFGMKDLLFGQNQV